MRDSAHKYQGAMRGAVEPLLRPLCRLLLHHAISYVALEGMIKRVYIDVANQEFNLPGKRSSAARVAVLSGMSRQEVRRLLVNDSSDVCDGGKTLDRARRVLSGWTCDADFLDAEGKPRLLEADGGTSFRELVKRYSGDMPVRAVLDELVRRGAVIRRKDSRLELISDGSGHSVSLKDLHAAKARIADLVDKIDRNLRAGTKEVP